MKTRILFIALFCFLTMPARAQGELTLGLVVGEPIGFSAKYWLGPPLAVQAYSTFDITKDFESGFSVDVVVNKGVHSDSDSYGDGFPFYFGIGVAHRGGSPSFTGMRIPLGFSKTWWNGAAHEVFFEFAPVLVSGDDTEGDLHIGIGYRGRIFH